MRKQKELRLGQYDELDLKEIWKTGGVFLLAAVIVAMIILGVSALIIAADNSTNRSYNEAAERYNALDLEQRQLVWEFFGGGYKKDVDPETYLIPLKDIRPFVQRIQAMSKFWPGLVLAAIVLISGCMAYTYYKQRDKKYYFVDFPMRTVGEVLTFCAMFAALPFMLVSGCCLLCRKLNLFQLERKEVQKLAKAELSEEDIAQIMLPKPARCTAKMRYAYYQARTARTQELHQQALEVAKHAVDGYRQDLAELGRRVQAVQRNLGTAQTKLEDLQRAQVAAITNEQSDAELRAILGMRGVAWVKPPDKKHRNEYLLKVLVKVRVSYQGDLYDFGDYVIIFKTTDFECNHARSGRKLNATSLDPDYSTLSGFCFGTRSETITEYVEEGRIVEAMALIVDSLHSVNSESIRSRIPDCFRKVKTVRRAVWWWRHLRKG